MLDFYLRYFFSYKYSLKKGDINNLVLYCSLSCFYIWRQCRFLSLISVTVCSSPLTTIRNWQVSTLNDYKGTVYHVYICLHSTVWYNLKCLISNNRQFCCFSFHFPTSFFRSDNPDWPPCKQVQILSSMVSISPIYSITKFYSLWTHNFYTSKSCKVVLFVIYFF